MIASAPLERGTSRRTLLDGGWTASWRPRPAARCGLVALRRAPHTEHTHRLRSGHPLADERRRRDDAQPSAALRRPRRPAVLSGGGPGTGARGARARRRGALRPGGAPLRRPPLERTSSLGGAPACVSSEVQKAQRMASMATLLLQ